MDQPFSKTESIASAMDNNVERKVGETIAERIRTSLADAITSGRIKPGSEIDELELAQSFGASRTPVREALRELAAAGLVTIKPRRGARVVEMTPDLVGELFELMAEVESICVRFATYRIKANERAALSHIHETSLLKMRAKDLDAYDLSNQEFHEILYGATHNSELQTYALALRRRGAPFRRAQFRGLERLKASWTEHDAILHAIFEGNGDAAAHLMRAHMLKAGDVFMDYTHEQEPSSSLSPSNSAESRQFGNLASRRHSSK